MDQLVATSRAEFIGDQVGCTGGGETGRPRGAFFWIGALRHPFIRRLTRQRNHIHHKIPSYRSLRKHGPLVRGDMRALVFELAEVFDGILLCRSCGPLAHLKRTCEHRHVPVARMICQKLPLASATTLRTRSHAAATSCGAWTSSETAAYLWATGALEGSIVKNLWRRTFVGMDMKNTWYCIGAQPAW